MEFELAGRYFGSGFGSAPLGLLMPTEPEEEMPTQPYQTMGQVTSPRSPSPLKAYDYVAPKKPPGKFSTEALSKLRAQARAR